MLDSVSNLHEFYYTTVHLVLLGVAALVRANLFSLIYGACWLLQVGLYPHPLLPRRLLWTKISVVLVGVSSLVTVLAQVIIQIIIAVDPSIDLDPLTSSPANVLHSLGWIDFSSADSSVAIRSLLPDVLVLFSSLYLCCYFLHPRLSENMFNFDLEHVRRCFHDLHSEPPSEMMLSLTLLLFLLSGVAAPSLLSSCYLLIFIVGCISLIYHCSFSKLFLHNRAWLWAIALGYTIFNMAVIYVLQFPFIYNGLTVRDLLLVGVHILSQEGRLMGADIHVWPYIVQYVGLSLLFMVLSYWSRRQFAMLKQPGIDQFDLLDGVSPGHFSSFGRPRSTAIDLPESPSGSDSDGDAEPVLSHPEMASTSTPYDPSSVELPPKAGFPSEITPMLFNLSAGPELQPSLIVSTFARHGWKLAYLLLLFISISIPSLLTLVFLLIFCFSTIAPLRWSLKLLPFTFIYSLLLIIALFVYNLPFKWLVEGSSLDTLLADIGLVSLTYPFPFLFLMGLSSFILSLSWALTRAFIAYCRYAGTSFDTDYRYSAREPPPQAASPPAPNTPTSETAPADTTFQKIRSMTVWALAVSAQFLMTLGSWVVEGVIISANKIALAGLFVCALTSISYLNAGYMLIFTIFVLFPKISSRYWVLLVIYTECVITTIFVWQLSWTLPYESEVQLVGLSHFNSFAHIYDVGQSIWEIWIGLFWHFIILVFSSLAFWIGRSSPNLPSTSSGPLFPEPAPDEEDGVMTDDQGLRLVVFAFHDPRRSLGNFSDLFYLFAARYGLSCVYLTLLLTGLLDTLSFCEVIYMTMLFVFTLIHIGFPGYATRIIARAWLVPLTISFLVFLMRYLYQFPPLAEAISNSYPSSSPFTLGDLGLIRYFDPNEPEKIFPAKVIGSLLSNGIIFVLCAIMLHAFLAAGGQSYALANYFPKIVNLVVSFVVRLSVLHAHKALLLALALTAIGNVNIFNFFYLLLAMLAASTRWGPSSLPVALPLGLLASVKSVAQMFFRFSYFLNQEKAARDHLAIWFGFVPNQGLWNAVIGDILVLGFLALTRLSQVWLQRAVKESLPAQGLTEPNASSREPCSLLPTRTQGVFDVAYQEMSNVGFFRVAPAGHPSRAIAPDRSSLFLDSLMWYLSNFFSIHGYHIFMFVLTIQIFVRLDALSFFGMAYLGLSALFSAPTMIRGLPFVMGYFIFTIAIQYVFLLGLPPLETVAWPWSYVLSLPNQRWLCLLFNRWELVSDFFVLLISALIIRAAIHFRPIADARPLSSSDASPPVQHSASGDSASGPVGLSVRVVGSVNSEGSSDSDNDDAPRLGSEEEREVEIAAKYASRNRHWLNTLKYYACASSIPLCLFFVFIAGTVGVDVISVGYVIFALYLSYHSSWVASAGQQAWMGVQLYNYCILVLQIIYQISFIPDSNSPWLTAFGFQKMIVWESISEQGSWSYDNVAFTSHGVVFDILILFLLAIQSRIFETQAFKDVHQYIRGRIRQQETKKRALWITIQNRDRDDFIALEHNELMSRNRLIAVKRLRAKGRSILDIASTEDTANSDLQQTFSAARVQARPAYLPYVASDVDVASTHKPLSHESSTGKGLFNSTASIASAPASSSGPKTPSPRPRYPPASSSDLIVIPVNDGSELEGSDGSEEGAGSEHATHSASAVGPEPAAPKPDLYESPFLPPKGPKPPGPGFLEAMDQLVTFCCDCVYQRAKYRTRDPEFLDRWSGLLVGAFSLLLTHSYLIVYLMMVIDMVVNSSLLSIYYPLALFGYAVLEYPMPPSKFWKTTIIYLSVVLIIKVVLNIPGWLQTNTAKLPFWVGIPNLQQQSGFLSGSVVCDLLLWLVLLWHRSILKSLGLWRTASEFRRSATGFTEERHLYRQEKARRQKQILESTVEEQSISSSKRSDHASQGPVSSSSSSSSSFDVAVESILEPILVDTPSEPPSDSAKFLMLMQQFKTKFFSYFTTIIHRQSPTSDYYTHVLIIDLVCFVFIALFPHPFTGVPQQDIPDAILNNRIPRAYLGILFFQFCIIILERILYLIKSAALKLLAQYVLLGLYHAFLFVVLPYFNDRRFYDEPVLVVFYLLKCLYFYYSAKQLRRGYPPFYDQTRFSVSPNLWNYMIQNIYTSVPFLWEARALLDWTFTPTTLTFFFWMNLEDIYTVLWIAAYNKWSRNFGHRVRGEGQALWMKVLLGIGGFCLLILIIWLPLFLLSSANPSNAPNPIYQSTVEVSIRGWNPLYANEQEQNIDKMSASQFKKLIKAYNGILSDQQGETQVVSLLNYSQTLFAMSPPSRQNLVSTLMDPSQSVTMQFTYTFFRFHPTGSLVLSGNTQTRLPQEQQAALARILNAEFDPNPTDWSFTVPGLFPRILRLPIASSIVTPASNTMVNCTLSFNRQPQLFNLSGGVAVVQMVEWWDLTQVEDSLSASLGFNASGPQLVIISDSVPTGFTASIASAGIIVLYTGIVFSIARFTRTWLTDGYANIPYEQMPEPDRIRRLCEDIYAARQFHDLNLEEELYWELIELYRSPERIIEVTQPFASKPKQD